ncbi:MAG: hypothetical protein RR228_02685 [Bacilli bacterium]
MELKKDKPVIYLISGKARNGKDTCASFIEKYYNNNNKKNIILQFSSYIKQYASKISGWDGSEETKPRELLQVLGTDVIRKSIDQKFFSKKLIDDIKVYSYFFDVIIVSDVRLKHEIDDLKEVFDNVYSINIERTNFDNGLTLEQKNHITEKDLDDYTKHDYKILNDSDLDSFNNKVIDMLKEIDKK